MNRQEKQEIREMDPKYRPIGAWGYFGYNILFGLPIIGFICLIIFAFSGSNINRRSYARSFFVAALLGLIVGVIIIVVAGPLLAEIIEEIMQQITPSDPEAVAAIAGLI